MVAKNNYYWSEKLTLELIANAKTEGKAPEEAEKVPFDFIANGDTAIVRRVRNERQFYGFTFVDATLEFPDFNDFQMQLTLLTDTLQAEAPALTKEQQDSLFNLIMEMILLVLMIHYLFFNMLLLKHNLINFLLISNI